MTTTILTIVAVLVVLAVYVAYIYNSLVNRSQQVDNGFAQIDVQLKRRYDLIPNLVSTAKAYMKHERETLEAVVAARNSAAQALEALRGNPTDATAAGALAGADGVLGEAIGRFQIAVEAYPDLKADRNMQQLSEELTATENKVAFARQSYNDFVTSFNIYRQSFPPILFAGTFGYREDRPLLEFEDRAQIQQAPKVEFDL